MRLYRNAIILVVVLGLLVGAYFVIKNKKPADNNAATNTQDTTVKVWDLDKEKISEIAIDNKGQKFVISKKDKDFVLSQPSDLKADKSRIDSIVTDVTAVSAEKLVTDNASDLSQYGLSSPAEVSVKMGDGTVKTLQIGSQTSTQDAYYMKEKDKNKVYTLATYTAEDLLVGRLGLKDKTLFTVKAEDINAFSMERTGKLVFSSKKDSSGNWIMTAPIDASADTSALGPMFDACTKVAVREYVEENAADLDKYGLKSPSYAIEFDTSGTKNRILIGNEKDKGSTFYAKLADSGDVFTMDESGFNFLDKPLKEIMEVFAYIVNIDDVSKIAVDIDGKTINCDLQTNKDDKDKDKFTVDGKDASIKDSKGDQPFRKFYQALIGVTLSDIEIGAKPQGKADITFTYTLKKAPGTMKVEFVSKDDKYYYVVKNGAYSNIIVAKSKFDEPDGVRAAYKALVDEMSKKK